MTAEELLAMPDDGFHHYELVKGELITMSPAGELHGQTITRLIIHLGSYVQANRLGELHTETGFLLTRNPDTVREPDIAFLENKRVTGGDKFVSGAPELAVEVISPRNTPANVEQKVREYLAAGTQIVIVIYPKKQTAIVHTPTSTTRLTTDDTLSGGDVVPGWSLPLRELFS
jgi:Uma2 family endonuclease